MWKILMERMRGYAIALKINIYLFYTLIFLQQKPNPMKNQNYEKQSFLMVFFNNVAKNFVMLFESGDKREFQRLKDFITS